MRRGGAEPGHGAHDDRVDRVGGHPQLDLLNTVSRRLDPAGTIEMLPDWEALLHWATAAEMFADRQGERFEAEALRDPDLAHATVGDVRSLRETSYRVLRPLATGETPRRQDVSALGDRISDALAKASIATIVPLTWTAPSTTIGDLPGLLALSAWHLLATEDLTRLRQCEDYGCGRLFLDRSKNLSRRWCSSSGCGNRERVRRHHRRLRSQRFTGSASTNRSTAPGQS